MDIGNKVLLAHPAGSMQELYTGIVGCVTITTHVDKLINSFVSTNPALLGRCVKRPSRRTIALGSRRHRGIRPSNCSSPPYFRSVASLKTATRIRPKVKYVDTLEAKQWHSSLNM